MPGAGKIVIKKYGNRRLYDTSSSRYVNLEDIASLIRNGSEVAVLDAKSGADRTRVTLTQIIVEEAKREPTGLSEELLRQLIMASAELRQHFMKTALQTYQKMQTAVQSGFAGVRSAAFSPLDLINRIFMRAAQERKDERWEVQELRSRLVQLERELKKRKGRKKARV